MDASSGRKELLGKDTFVLQANQDGAIYLESGMGGGSKVLSDPASPSLNWTSFGHAVSELE